MNELLGNLSAFGASWRSVGGQLLASVVLFLSGVQDLGLRARIGAAFWFLMAIAFGISALVTAIWANIWTAVASCIVVLCTETWLMLRWRRKTVHGR